MIGWLPSNEESPDASSLPSFSYLSEFASFTFQDLASTLSTTCITSVTLHCTDNNESVVSWYLCNFIHIIAGLRALREVKVLFPGLSTEAIAKCNPVPESDGAPQVYSPEQEQGRVMAGIEKANELLGTTAKLTHIYAGDGIHDGAGVASYAEFDEYVWFTRGEGSVFEVS